MKVFNQRGFSLVEIMVSMGLLGILGLAAVTLTDKFGRQQSDIVGKDEYNEFMNSLASWLPSEVGCNAFLVGKDFPLNGETNFEIDGYKGYAASEAITQSPVIKPGYLITKKLRVESVILRDKKITPAVTQIDNQKYRKVVAQIEIKTHLISGAGADTKEQMKLRSRFIEIPVFLAMGNTQIKRCSGEMSFSDVCSAVGSVFDPVTGTCKPMVNCEFKGTYATLTCNPSQYGCVNALSQPMNNQFTNDQSCPDGSTASQTGVFDYTHQVDCGKKCTLTVEDKIKYFICVRCN